MMMMMPDLLLSPAERGVVEMSPDAGDDPGAVEYQPGEGQGSPPLPSTAAQYQQNIHQDRGD